MQSLSTREQIRQGHRSPTRRETGGEAERTAPGQTRGWSGPGDQPGTPRSLPGKRWYALAFGGASEMNRGEWSWVYLGGEGAGGMAKGHTLGPLELGLLELAPLPPQGDEIPAPRKLWPRVVGRVGVGGRRGWAA